MSILSTKIFAPLGVVVMVAGGASKVAAQNIDLNICFGDKNVSGCLNLGNGILGGTFNGGARRGYRERFEIPPNGSCPNGYLKSRTGNASKYTYWGRDGHLHHYGTTYCTLKRN